MDCHRAETYVLRELRAHLSPTLYYHGLHHTLDVVQQAQALAEGEGITDSELLALLRTAAYYHDSGFMTTYQGHEAAGCDLARRVLPDLEYTPAQIELICDLIMATRLPQSPGDSLLAKILCDADLDYLGRPDDFWPISQTLRKELEVHGSAVDDHTWNLGQEKFLSTHHYWTTTATARREAAKQARLAEVRALLA
ncbi:HD domain-containing protein [Hymenobacter crusticola]|uniref:Phosphohydrolase n=1 Tax=Hymenobacter crusticola TaxID=1770526 RepID=A0A243WJ23_9BACT|nr:HD domain-containing protein [Hymenobacter crusticola]OUJ75898.1 phosphohydrolase [Hymenobacter crusticola]